MELQNYFPRDDIRDKVIDVAKYIANEVKPDERDEAIFSIYLQVKKLLENSGDSFSMQFTCSELTEKLIESTRNSRHVVAIRDGLFLKAITSNG